jgi:hypothetical protein
VETKDQVEWWLGRRLPCDDSVYGKLVSRFDIIKNLLCKELYLPIVIVGEDFA